MSKDLILKYDKGENAIGRPTYTVSLQTKYGTFTNSVSPCDTDVDYTSDWDGFSFAETLCYIDKLHRKALNYKERAQGAENVFNSLMEKYSTKGLTEEQLDFLTDLSYQVNVAWREYDKLFYKYKTARDSFRNYTDEQIEKRKKVIEHCREQQAAQQMEQ